ncbi:MAG: hypothetical protein ACRDZT_03835 [Acidimicrobiales bacterium]
MTSTQVPPLFADLVDDAGLFPPEELPMRAALERHQVDINRANGVLSGRFLCPAGSIGELLGQLGAEDQLDLALVTPLEEDTLRDALESLAADGRVRLAGIEGPPASSDLSVLELVPADVPCSVEVPATGDWRAALSMLGGTAYRAKVRCGGARAELFPTADQLGAFVTECAARDLPFKATAGLHHALGHVDPATSFRHHGFLNLLLSACRAVEGAPEEHVVAALCSTDAAALVAEAQAVREDHAKAARRLFVSYGSCSTSEPVEDLASLGLIAPARGRP